MPSIDILIVGDHQSDVHIWLSYLNEYGYGFEVASTPSNVLICLKSNYYQLILIDLEWTALPALELVKTIRKDLLIQVPIVAISAKPLASFTEKCFDAGVNGCIEKPVGKKELAGLLSGFLPKELLPAVEAKQYVVIDLDDLHEISMGDAEQEKEIASTFLTILDKDLNDLSHAFASADQDGLKIAAHRMLSTIYVMGMKPKLEKQLKAIERGELSPAEVKSNLDVIGVVCEIAKKEVEDFIGRLSKL